MQQPLLDQEELETTLLKHSRIHFAQAKGSPFTTKPLSHLLNYDGLTPFGNHLMQGCLATNPYHFDEPTMAILNNLKCKVQQKPGTTNTLDHSMLLKGINKWPEKNYDVPIWSSSGDLQSIGKTHCREEEKHSGTPLT